ncbi:gluconokinase [Gloeocapsopsis crepidinum LEGE 06123]|uniref:Gluconokinase n=1 Tax=Gloeocapsopsis crepidinum LEGE 06123 TaxID=588587 RepID=A0ABR9UQH6_9CHRO|nr:gluconokinase [Gloeocapsopsis crepidinum]MBE9190519.1 gluconokinase [Gloeocapsopsis crepidinum LEGE 06123]
MSQNYFIGVDLGTTSTKAIVFSTSGAIKGMGNQGYKIIVPKPTWAEQDPEAIFSAVIAAVRDAVDAAEISKSAIAALGFSAATHSLIAVDAKNYPLTNAIIWADNRSIHQTEQLKQQNIKHDLYLRTGSPIHPVSVVTKLMWMRETNPDVFEKAAKFISIKEYVFYQLFERYIIDYSIASATGLLNLKQLDWDEEALELAGIRSEKLSDLVSPTHVLRGMKTRHAEVMGIAPDTPVVIGANDGVLANLGVGAIAKGEVAITIGTSGAVRTVVDTPLTDEKERTFCYALTEKHWVIGGPTNNGGIVLRWFRDNFCAPEVETAKQLGVDPYDLMIEAAMEVSPGAEGLLCLPYLSGERAPYWNAKTRGLFFGVGLHHGRSHFIRAIMEGILFNVYSVNVALQELTGDIKEIRASGGFARSTPWRQLMADLFGIEVLMPEVYEGSGFGAAVLAMYSVGAIADLTEAQKLIRITYRHKPDSHLVSTYHDLFPLYERLYQNLENEFSAIADYQSQAIKRT